MILRIKGVPVIYREDLRKSVAQLVETETGIKPDVRFIDRVSVPEPLLITLQPVYTEAVRFAAAHAVAHVCASHSISLWSAKNEKPSPTWYRGFYYLHLLD